MRRRLLCLVLVVLAVLYIGFAVPAAGQSLDSTDNPTTTAPAVTSTTVGSGGVLDGKFGNHPLSAYEIGYEEHTKIDVNLPGPEDDIAKKIAEVTTGFKPEVVDPRRFGKGETISGAWIANIGAASVALALVGVVWDWAASDMFAEPVAVLGRLFEAGILGPFHVRDVVLLTVGVVAVIRFARTRRASAGWRTILTSVLILAVAQQMMMKPAELYQTTIHIVDRAGGVFSGGEGNKSTLRLLNQTLVAGPFDNIQWGHRLEGECDKVGDRILAAGLSGSYAGRKAMAEAGCIDEAKFSAEPSTRRILDAVFTTLNTVMIVILIVALTATVIAFQFAAAFLAVPAPAVALLAGLPGQLRRIAWRWLGAIATCAAGAVGTRWLLDIALRFTGAVDGADSPMPPIVRFVFKAGLVIGVFLWRKRILAVLQRGAARVSMAAASTFGDRGAADMIARRTIGQEGNMGLAMVSPWAADVAHDGGRAVAGGVLGGALLAAGAPAPVSAAAFNAVRTGEVGLGTAAVHTAGAGAAAAGRAVEAGVGAVADTASTVAAGVHAAAVDQVAPTVHAARNAAAAAVDATLPVQVAVATKATEAWEWLTPGPTLARNVDRAAAQIPDGSADDAYGAWTSAWRNAPRVDVHDPPAEALEEEKSA